MTVPQMWLLRKKKKVGFFGSFFLFVKEGRVDVPEKDNLKKNMGE